MKSPYVTLVNFDFKILPDPLPAMSRRTLEPWHGTQRASNSSMKDMMGEYYEDMMENPTIF